MKLNECPNCGNKHLSDTWKPKRKLQQSCDECGWHGKIRIPETIEIKTTKEVIVNQFYGFCYEVFDKYGHIMTHSKSYHKKKEAESELLQEITRGEKDKDAGPYVGILWPDIVHVKGKVYKNQTGNSLMNNH